MTIKAPYITHLLFFCFSINLLFASEPLEVQNLQCEMLFNPIGIDATAPRFSWKISAEGRAIKQVAYQIIVSTSEAKLSIDDGDVWNSGKVDSDKSILVSYKGRKLNSRQQCFWKVKVWINNGTAACSKRAYFSMGFLQPTDWKAKWIGLDRAFPWDSVTKFSRLSARYFRKEFYSVSKIKKATVYISGLGLYELYINGNIIGDQVLAPSPTDYSKTIKYNTFDVTSQLNQGKNTIGTVLGNGRFFTMRQNYKPQKWHTFGFPKMIVQLEIQYNDGTLKIFKSDQTWKVTADGPIRTNNEYDGEEYNAMKELNGWNKNGYNDSKWISAELVKAPGGVLEAQMNPNMQILDYVHPVSIKQMNGKRYILDMGQNMAGWVKIKVYGNKGNRITLRYAESLKPNGELYTANLRDAKVTDVYTLKGGGVETWSPRFVFHGFRYVEVEGYPGTPSLTDFVGEVIYDNMKTIGSLETSNEIINKVHKNAFWGIRSNYKGMPIDCPQRNERQPWLGDRTTGAYGESFLFSNAKLYSKWLDDIADAQTAEGSIPDVAPNFWYYYKDNMTWPGAYLKIADMLYRQFGDNKPILKHYTSMKKWMGYMKRKYLTTAYIMTKDSYGDWCVPPESPELIHSKDSARITDPKLLATAYYYHLLQVMKGFALLSNRTADVNEFETEAMKVKGAFNKTFYNQATGRYSNNTVTANLLPLAFKIAPESESEKIFRNITDKIVVQNYTHISTGVVGTQWIMRWLTYFNRPDLAYKLASNTTYPSWGYMVKNGATTIWELWNGNTADPAMNSQNHVMLLGDLLIWMYEDLAGIRSDSSAVAFKTTIMKPAFNCGLNYVNSSYQSPYGQIKSDWKKQENGLSWNIDIPANSEAIIYLPAISDQLVKESGKNLKEVKGIELIRVEVDNVVIKIGSGKYSFTVNK
ncbi:MAG: family 78 glycoside hydrolase catalytic domain [Candidatus Dadabacteria bacterium]